MKFKKFGGIISRAHCSWPHFIGVHGTSICTLRRTVKYSTCAILVHYIKLSTEHYLAYSAQCIAERQCAAAIGRRGALQSESSDADPRHSWRCARTLLCSSSAPPSIFPLLRSPCYACTVAEKVFYQSKNVHSTSRAMSSESSSSESSESWGPSPHFRAPSWLLFFTACGTPIYTVMVWTECEHFAAVNIVSATVCVHMCWSVRVLCVTRIVGEYCTCTLCNIVQYSSVKYWTTVGQWSWHERTNLQIYCTCTVQCIEYFVYAADNVHFQHVARLIKLLNRNNVLYDLQVLHCTVLVVTDPSS